MSTKLATRKSVAPALQPFVVAEQGKMPLVLARLLTPVVADLGVLEVIHPTPADPVLLADGRVVALWIEI